jgi:F-type H+-transporting ATPase subunit b
MFRSAAVACLLLLFAYPAKAANPEHASLADLLWPTFNFLLLLAVIIYFARKPIQAFFTARRNEIQTELEDAASQLSEAEATYAKWQRCLINLEEELEEIRATSRQRAEAERDRILSDARSSAERIRREAAAAVELELRRARKELSKEAAQLALELAAEQLEREITDTDQDRLIDEFIDRVAAAPAAGAGRPEDF